jgi:hypothetical protein
MTKHEQIWSALAAPFLPEQVKEREQGGRRLSYVTAPTVANRLDEVLGPENWDFELTPWGQDALIGTLVIRLPDGQVVRKSNVGGAAEMKAGDDAAKSTASDCLKRCAVLAGVARYLYRDGVPRFGHEVARGREEPPAAPRPTNGQARPPQPQQSDDEPPAPRSGREFFARLKAADEEHDYGLVKHLNAWGKRNEFPSKMIDWEGEDLLRGHAEACRVVRAKRRLEESTTSRWTRTSGKPKGGEKDDHCAITGTDDAPARGSAGGDPRVLRGEGIPADVPHPDGADRRQQHERRQLSRQAARQEGDAPPGQGRRSDTLHPGRR